MLLKITASASARSSLQTRMSSGKAKNCGWAAFVQKERKKQQGLEPNLDEDPFPPVTLPNTLSTHPSYKAKNTSNVLEKPFSSVLLPSPNFASLEQNKGSNSKQLSVGNFSSGQGNNVFEKGDNVDLYKKIKELHSWADEDLIKDVMAGVDYEFDQAIMLLEAMVTPDQTHVLHKDLETEKPCTNKVLNTAEASAPFVQKTKKERDIKFGDDWEDMRHALNNCLDINNKDLINASSACGDRLPGNASWDFFRFVPVEPEFWEEDDIYLIQRKDAIRMMRSAVRHSKAANDAYLRGDHLTAQHFSLKAREEWLAAGKLNSKAAKEILGIRNSKNDEWTLDLHGLHATEAVEALQEHLKKIESQVSLNHSVYPREVKLKAGFESTASLEYSNCIEADGSTKRQQPPSKQRPSMLQVITGKGNHSQGEAAIPIAIRSFITENGYRYDEGRPGVIALWPKFRRQ